MTGSLWPPSDTLVEERNGWGGERGPDQLCINSREINALFAGIIGGLPIVNSYILTVCLTSLPTDDCVFVNVVHLTHTLDTGIWQQDRHYN